MFTVIFTAYGVTEIKDVNTKNDNSIPYISSDVNYCKGNKENNNKKLKQQKIGRQI